jgi:hypothetical protein
MTADPFNRYGVPVLIVARNGAFAAVAVMQQFGRYRGKSGQCADIADLSLLMWWTVPAPGNEVP